MKKTPSGDPPPDPPPPSSSLSSRTAAVSSALPPSLNRNSNFVTVDNNVNKNVNNNFYCSLCDKSANNSITWNDHIKSKLHVKKSKSKVTETPPTDPKVVPVKKQSRIKLTAIERVRNRISMYYSNILLEETMGYHVENTSSRINAY